MRPDPYGFVMCGQLSLLQFRWSVVSKNQFSLLFERCVMHLSVCPNFFRVRYSPSILRPTLPRFRQRFEIGQHLGRIFAFPLCRIFAASLPHLCRIFAASLLYVLGAFWPFASLPHLCRIFWVHSVRSHLCRIFAAFLPHLCRIVGCIFCFWCVLQHHVSHLLQH